VIKCPSEKVEFRALGTTRKEQHRSDQGATLENIVVAGVSRSLARTF